MIEREFSVAGNMMTIPYSKIYGTPIRLVLCAAQRIYKFTFVRFSFDLCMKTVIYLSFSFSLFTSLLPAPFIHFNCENIETFSVSWDEGDSF